MNDTAFTHTALSVASSTGDTIDSFFIADLQHRSSQTRTRIFANVRYIYESDHPGDHTDCTWTKIGNYFHAIPSRKEIARRARHDFSPHTILTTLNHYRHHVTKAE